MYDASDRLVLSKPHDETVNRYTEGEDDPMRYAPLLFACALMAGMTGASAQENKPTVIFDIDPRWMSLGNTAEVEVSDQVSDGCWTNVEATKNAVTLELQRNGFTVSDEEFFPLRITLVAVGYRDQFGCVASHSLEVRVPAGRDHTIDNHTVSSLYYDELWRGSGILSGPNTSVRLKEAFVEQVQAFLVYAPKAKREVAQKAEEAAKDAAVKAFWRSQK